MQSKASRIGQQSNFLALPIPWFLSIYLLTLLGVFLFFLEIFTERVGGNVTVPFAQ